VWTYEPAEGWDNYGAATVTPDGSQVVPKPGLHVDGFQGASLSGAMLALTDALCWQFLKPGRSSSSYAADPRLETESDAGKPVRFSAIPLPRK
jgi:hypothetical protein